MLLPRMACCHPYRQHCSCVQEEFHSRRNCLAYHGNLHSNCQQRDTMGTKKQIHHYSILWPCISKKTCIILPKQCGAQCRYRCHPHKPWLLGWWSRTFFLNCELQSADEDLQQQLMNHGWEMNLGMMKGQMTGNEET